MDYISTKRIPYVEAAWHVCPDCDARLRCIPTSYGWRADCDCYDRRWTWVRGDTYVQAERR